MVDMAGDLWILLVNFAVKLQRARDKAGRTGLVVTADDGECLWRRLEEVVAGCERPMLKAARKESGGGLSMGVDAGREFVDTMFGRERKLSKTEKLVSGMRLWVAEFDAEREDGWTYVDDAEESDVEKWAEDE